MQWASCVQAFFVEFEFFLYTSRSYHTLLVLQKHKGWFDAIISEFILLTFDVESMGVPILEHLKYAYVCTKSALRNNNSPANSQSQVYHTCLVSEQREQSFSPVLPVENTITKKSFARC